MTALELRERTESEARAIAAFLNMIFTAHYGEREVDADEIRMRVYEAHIDSFADHRAERSARLYERAGVHVRRRDDLQERMRA